MKKTNQEKNMVAGSGFNEKTRQVSLENLLAEASCIENAPYHVMKEEKSFSGGGLEKYINTTVGNHATCATTSCRAKPITYKTENRV